MEAKNDNINEDKLRLNKDAKILLLIASLFTIGIGLSNTFVNVYIWRLKQNFVLIGIYNLFIHIFTPITFVLSGYLSKNRNGTIALRLGIIFHALFFFIILILQKKAANYVIPLGSFLGIAAGFYWLAFQVLTFDLTNDMNRDTFNSYHGMFGALSGMFAPLTAGFIINTQKNLTGYYIVFGISLAIFIIIIAISTVLKTYKFEGKFKLGYIIKNSRTSWRSILTSNFFFGIRNGILMFLINLLIFIVVQNELSIGKTTLIGAFISIVSFQIIEKIMKPDKRKIFLTTGTIMMLLAVTPILLKINFINIIIFIIINSFFTPFFNVPFHSASYNIIDKSGHPSERIEYIIFREIALNLGRILGILLFIYIASGVKEISELKILLFIAASSQLVIPFLIKKINKTVKVL